MSTHGLIKKLTLTVEEQAEILQLVALCNAHDDSRLRLHGPMLANRPGTAANDILYYQDDTLVGYLNLDNGVGGVEREAVGMVHPAYRRRGIGYLLLREASMMCAQQGSSRLVLDCERSSSSGQSFIRTTSAKLDFSEHEMVLTSFQERATFDDRLQFRQATREDLDTLVTILSSDAKGEEEWLRSRLLAHFQHTYCQIYLSTFGEEGVGCEEPVGTLRIEEMGGGEIGIYGFVILPDYRDRGYGRQMLTEIIQLLYKKNRRQIMLDVDTSNTRALHLYRSIGFTIRTTYDYYTLRI